MEQLVKVLSVVYCVALLCGQLCDEDRTEKSRDRLHVSVLREQILRFDSSATTPRHCVAIGSSYGGWVDPAPDVIDALDDSNVVLAMSKCSKPSHSEIFHWVKRVSIRRSRATVVASYDDGMGTEYEYELRRKGGHWIVKSVDELRVE